MVTSYKIVALPEERVVNRRPVPLALPHQVDPLENFCFAFSGFPSPDNPEQIGKAQAFFERHQLTLTIEDFGATFARPAFKAELKTKEARGYLCYLILLLIKANKPHGAKSLITILSENSLQDIPLQITLLLLGAKNETETKGRNAKLSNAMRLHSQNPLLGLVCLYFLATSVIENNLFEQLLSFLSRFPQLSETSNNPFGRIIRPLLIGDNQSAQEVNQFTIDRYVRALSQVDAFRDNFKEGVEFCLLSSLKAALTLKLALAYQHAHQTDRAAASLAALEPMATADLYFGPATKQILWNTLGEHALCEGREREAEVYFKRSVAIGLTLHAQTRLNELEVDRQAASPQLSQIKTARLLGGLEREIAQRTSFTDNAHKPTLALLQLQRFTAALSSDGSLPESRQQALLGLYEAVEDTPLAPVVLAFLASRPDTDGKYKRRLIKTALPETVTARSFTEREILLTLFGSDDPRIVAESAKAIKRTLAEATPATQLPITSLPSTGLEELRTVYNTKAAELRAATKAYLVDAKAGKVVLYSGEVYNAFSVVREAGIAAVHFRADRAERTVMVRFVNFRGESFERSFDQDLNLFETNDHPFYQLLTLIALDYFLAVQQEAYQPIFIQIDFKHFYESEFLQADRLRLLVARSVSASEAALDQLQLKLETAPSEAPEEVEELEEREIGGRETSLGMQQVIFAHGAAKETLAALDTPKIRINIPRQASLLPLAKLLDSMEIEPLGKEISIKLYSGPSIIHVMIDSEGNIQIVDYNRGITNLALIQQLNEVVLDILNALFEPRCREIISAPDRATRRSRLEEVFRSIQDTKSGRDEKWAVYDNLPKNRRPFEIEQVVGQEHPFDSTFFEQVTIETERGRSRTKLIPQPHMTVDDVFAALLAGRQIVMVGWIKIHRVRVRRPISEEKINAYILRHILNRRILLDAATDEDLQAIQAVRAKLLAGRITTDPHKLLCQDPDDPTKLTMDKIVKVMVDGQETSQRIFCSYRIPFVVRHVLEVTPSHTLRSTRGRKAGRTSPRPALSSLVREEAPLPAPTLPTTQAPPVIFLAPTKPPAPTKPVAHDADIKAQAELTAQFLALLETIKPTAKNNLTVIAMTTGIGVPRLMGIVDRRVAATAADLTLLQSFERRRKEVSSASFGGHPRRGFRPLPHHRFEEAFPNDPSIDPEIPTGGEEDGLL